MKMKPQRILVTYLFVFPLFIILLGVLMLSAWTIEIFQLKKLVPIRDKT